MSDTTKDAHWEIQKAVDALLDGRIDCKLYDSVPSKAAYPYVTHGDMPRDAPHEARGVSGRMVPYALNVWSRSKAGKKECALLVDEIVVAMTGYRLTMESFYEVEKHFLSSAIERLEEEEGNSFRGTVTFMITVAKTT